jgi:hypothetical protein
VCYKGSDYDLRDIQMIPATRFEVRESLESGVHMFVVAMKGKNRLPILCDSI